MTFREYLAKANKFAEENPSFLDLPIVKEVMDGEFFILDVCPVEGHYIQSQDYFTRKEYLGDNQTEINAISINESVNW